MMSDRITQKQLESLVDYVNKITGSPAASYTKTADGKYICNIGNYHLSGAYSGWQLQRMVNDGGGVSTPLGGGYCTKRELYDKLHAFIRGIETGKENRSNYE